MQKVLNFFYWNEFIYIITYVFDLKDKKLKLLESLRFHFLGIFGFSLLDKNDNLMVWSHSQLSAKDHIKVKPEVFVNEPQN